MTETTVLLASAGRRPYLARWFSQAFKQIGVEGRVVVADVDLHAPARAYATDFLHAPPVASSEYSAWLVQTLRDEKVDLAISVNDFELSHWATLGNNPVFAPLVRLSPSLQEAVEDKRGMSRLLSSQGIRTPELVSLDDTAAWSDREVVLKGRFGSGSRGLRITRGMNVASLLPGVLSEVTHRDGRSSGGVADPEEVVVAQERISGTEFGLDVICNLSEQFVSVLVRKKLSMRAGETDRAITVAPEDFEDLARRLAVAVPHRAGMDVDVIVDGQQRMWVIDVNPRFGGGYPFSHVAGADVPAAIVGWLTGATTGEQHLRYEAEVVGSKSVEIVRLT